MQSGYTWIARDFRKVEGLFFPRRAGYKVPIRRFSPKDVFLDDIILI